MNLTYEDCLALCDLTEDEIRAIAEHENMTELAALELGQYLIHTPDGERHIRHMIIDDIERAKHEHEDAHVLRLKAVLKHFIDTHPLNPENAD